LNPTLRHPTNNYSSKCINISVGIPTRNTSGNGTDKFEFNVLSLSNRSRSWHVNDSCATSGRLYHPTYLTKSP